MTLLVGILCSDGVVVAADRAVTFGTTDGSNKIRTILHLACKLVVLDSGLIVAGTGHVGAGQRFCDTAAIVWDQHIVDKPIRPVEVGRMLCGAAVNDFRSTGMNEGTVGALVAFPSDEHGPQLFEFPILDFQPERKNSNTWFVAMGSAQPIADAYLAIIRDAFWKDGMPTLNEGLFAAAWIMRNSIRASPGFVSEPVDIAVLQGRHARMLEADELSYYMDVADQATKHFGTFAPSAPTAPGKAKESAVPAQPIPEPPAAK